MSCLSTPRSILGDFIQQQTSQSHQLAMKYSTCHFGNNIPKYPQCQFVRNHGLIEAREHTKKMVSMNKKGI